VEEISDLKRITPDKITKRKGDLNEKRKRRALVTLGILIALFIIIISYVPICCLRLFESFGYQVHSETIRRFGFGIVCINSGVNRNMYGIRSQDFRSAIKLIYDKYIVRRAIWSNQRCWVFKSFWICSCLNSYNIN